MASWGWAPEWLQAIDVEDVLLVAFAALLVLVSGLMSGLTLGLMSLDQVDMELLRRTGTEHEKRMAAKIAPIITNQHYLLVTLLLCNAVAMEALPLVLDRLADPLTAVLISVTVVLVFGEIVPQAVCSRWAQRQRGRPALGLLRAPSAQQRASWAAGAHPAAPAALPPRAAGTAWRWARTAAGWCAASCCWWRRWPGRWARCWTCCWARTARRCSGGWVFRWRPRCAAGSGPRPCEARRAPQLQGAAVQRGEWRPRQAAARPQLTPAWRPPARPPARAPAGARSSRSL
jgi:hypothetical protein